MVVRWHCAITGSKDAGFTPYSSLSVQWSTICVDPIEHKCHHLFYGEFTRFSNR